MYVCLNMYIQREKERYAIGSICVVSSIESIYIYSIRCIVDPNSRGEAIYRILEEEEEEENILQIGYNTSDV